MTQNTIVGNFIAPVVTDLWYLLDYNSRVKIEMLPKIQTNESVVVSNVIFILKYFSSARLQNAVK